MVGPCLIVFAIAAQAETEGKRIVDVLTASEVDVLPRLKPLPPGLPDPRDMPADGKWVDKDPMFRLRRGTFLPAPLDLEVMDRLEVCEGFPELAQVHIDALGRVHEKKIDETRQVTDGKWMIQQIDRDEPIDWMGRALVGTGGIVLGTLLTLFIMTR